MMIHILNYFFFSIMNTNSAALLGFLQSRHCFLCFCDKETLCNVQLNLRNMANLIDTCYHYLDVCIHVVLRSISLPPISKDTLEEKELLWPRMWRLRVIPSGSDVWGRWQEIRIWTRLSVCVGANVYGQECANRSLGMIYDYTQVEKDAGWLATCPPDFVISGVHLFDLWWRKGIWPSHCVADNPPSPPWSSNNSGEKIASQKIQLPAKKMSR